MGLKALLRHEDIATTARYVFLQPEDLAPRLAKVALGSDGGKGVMSGQPFGARG